MQIMNNYQYFKYSKDYKEEIFDPFYKKGVLIIPKDSSENNKLTENNKKLVEYITTFKVLSAQNYSKSDKPIIDTLKAIIDIMTNTKYINYSAFSQFFMVYNSTYNYFLSLNVKDKFDYVYEMLVRYCAERHDIYSSHGYTNSILQVMCDNYSHKRNGKTTIDKVMSIILHYDLKRVYDIKSTQQENFYFLPDKGDSMLFENFLTKYSLKMESRNIEQGKLPDLVFNIKGQYYICELKTIKGSGGGQNKQIVELIHFIRFSEADNRFHYVAFLDGDYANVLFNSNTNKQKNQREEIEKLLQQNPNNYFLNTEGLRRFIKDKFE